MVGPLFVDGERGVTSWVSPYHRELPIGVEPMFAHYECAVVATGPREQEWASRDLNPHARRHRYLTPACLPFHHRPLS